MVYNLRKLVLLLTMATTSVERVIDFSEKLSKEIRWDIVFWMIVYTHSSSEISSFKWMKMI